MALGILKEGGREERREREREGEGEEGGRMEREGGYIVTIPVSRRSSVPSVLLSLCAHPPEPYCMPSTAPASPEV